MVRFCGACSVESFWFREFECRGELFGKSPMFSGMTYSVSPDCFRGSITLNDANLFIPQLELGQRTAYKFLLEHLVRSISLDTFF